MKTEPLRIQPTTRARPVCGEPIPVTVQQEWALSRVPKLDHYIMVPVAIRLTGDLNVSALKDSLLFVVDRHDSLRTTIRGADGQYEQLINPPESFHLDIIDCDSARASDQQPKVEQIIGELVNRPVDPATGPVLRVSLLRLSDHEHILVVVLHHIISDVVSYDLFFQELWMSYVDLSKRRHFRLLSRPMQYAEYAIWQKNAEPQWMQQHEPYWKSRLDGATRIQWPVMSGLENVQSTTPATFQVSLSEALSIRLQDLARRERTPLSLVIFTLYILLAARWCNQTDFVIPVVSTGRQSSQHVKVMGLIAQFLFMRMQLNPADTFLDVLKRVSGEYMAANEHVDLGRITRDRPDLLEGTSFNWLSWDLTQLGIPTLPEWSETGITTEAVLVPPLHRGAKPLFQLGISFWSGARGIRGYGLYRPDLFSPDMVKRLARDFRLLSERVVQNPCAGIL